jgi:outer membrane murein-binding lipoprotein Lpp
LLHNLPSRSPGVSAASTDVKQGVVCSSRASEDKVEKQVQKINIKVEKLDGNTRRAARKAVATVLHVDRARLLDVDGISKNNARLLPRAILEALTDRIRARQWQSALKVWPEFEGP